jgi:FKBP-type peptidyl-prolyl cis-trans isomerase
MLRLGALLAACSLIAVSALPVRAADSSLSEQANAAFLAANATKPGVVVRPSGLQYRIITSGYGKRPGAFDTVTCNYTGTLINGKIFDKTEPELPAQFVVNQLIPGWTEALELMREGDHWQLVIPSNLAYGARGAGNGVIPPNQTLVFDLELIKDTPPPPKKPGEDDNDNNSSQ